MVFLNILDALLLPQILLIMVGLSPDEPPISLREISK